MQQFLMETAKNSSNNAKLWHLHYFRLNGIDVTAIIGGKLMQLDEFITQQSTIYSMVMHSTHFAIHLMQMDVPTQQYLIFHWHEITQLIYWAGNGHWYGFGDVWERELVCMDEGGILLKWGGGFMPLQLPLFGWLLWQ
jgi:hypothetical protein